jgi:uracil-DNA glycosylase
VRQLPLTGEEGSGADTLIPDRLSLKALRDAAEDCTACPLHKDATQTVFGEGLKRARLMMVGEQPGDREDVEGHPFVGPAGRILDKGLERAGIERRDAYVTNVVKHFKWKPKGKRRIHQQPRAEEIKACAPWLEGEIEVVDPELILCLGAVAVKALMGPSYKVMRDRGKVGETELGRPAMPTVHPSSILRGPEEDRRDAMAAFVKDLKSAAGTLKGS